MKNQFLKVDVEQRIVYGWASVTKVDGELVVDRQGDIITSEEMSKAVTVFMEDVRVGKTMHVGEETGKIIHSLFLTEELAKSLGFETKQEGWIVGYKVKSDELWEQVKMGKYPAFSIGGRSDERII